MDAGAATTATSDRPDPSQPSARTIPYEPGLDGLRAVSIIGVLLFHAAATSGLDGWFRGGNLGVSVFFTLSGFLITTLLLTEHRQTGRVSLARFWTRRIRRLVPASLAVVAVVTALSTTSWFDLRRSDAWAAIWSVTNWHVIASGEDQLLRTIVGPLGPTWSLAVEEQFYVLLGVGLWLASRRRDAVRVVAVGASVVTVASVALANVVSDWSPRLEFGTDVRAAELAIGCLLGVVLLDRRDRLQMHRDLADAVGAAAIAATVLLFLTAGTAPWLLRGGHALLAVVWAASVVSVVAHGRVSRAMSWPPLVAIGRWSYSLYLVHWPAFLVLSADRTGLDGVVLVALKLGVAFALALVLHLLVEQPLRRSRAATRTTVTAWLTASVLVSALALAALG